jgi:hypothetical protein
MGCWGYSMSERSSGNSASTLSESSESMLVINNLPEQQTSGVKFSGVGIHFSLFGLLQDQVVP